MRVLRGRAETLAADRERTQSLLDQVAATRAPAVRVWRPPRNIAFGRRDGNRDGYERARTIAAQRDYPIAERSVGGHAVAFTGNTVAFARVDPVEEARTGISERYDRVTGLVVAGLRALGVDVEQGEPEGAFCPGTHSLSARGKIVGLAQRVHSDVATTSGILVVQDHEAIASVLDPIYNALDVPFDPDAVGSIRRAGGETDPETVLETLGDHLTGDHEPRVEVVRET
jgi:lipoate-protein ligase A